MPPTPGVKAPLPGELLSDLEGFLGDEMPTDDVTLIVVKVLWSLRLSKITPG